MVRFIIDFSANSLQCYHCNDTFPPMDSDSLPDCVFSKTILGELITCDEPETTKDANETSNIKEADSGSACMMSISVMGKST